MIRVEIQMPQFSNIFDANACLASIDDTVGQIKLVISYFTGYPESTIRLILLNTVLFDDSRSLESYGVPKVNCAPRFPRRGNAVSVHANQRGCSRRQSEVRSRPVLIPVENRNRNRNRTETGTIRKSLWPVHLAWDLRFVRYSFLPALCIPPPFKLNTSRECSDNLFVLYWSQEKLETT